MYLGEYIQVIYGIIGSIFCHQLPERTLCLDHLLMPACARDVGIYSGVFISALFSVFMKRINSDKPPRLIKSIFLCAMMVPMMMDGFTSYIGIRDTNNVIRFITGTYFGMAIPLFLIPVANFSIDFENKNPILKTWYELIAIITVNAMFAFLVLKTNFISWYVLSTMVVLCFILTIGRLVFTVVTRLYSRRPSFFLTSSLTIGVLVCMFVISRILIKFKDIFL